MNQTKLESFIEAGTNILIGFTINFSANLLILPLFYGSVAESASKAFYIGLIFTGISLLRSYILRRWFNGLKFGDKLIEWFKKKRTAVIN